MIRSFKHDLAEDLFMDRITKATKRFPAELRLIAQRKLQYLNAAISLLDLRSPPGNRLKALKAERKGTYSIRINDKWRVVFGWNEGVINVEFIDYH